ncbi:MAG: OprO/OprP family phosphate-selective porin [Proteobacteria bacterium]|nr:OprO/OprP family phosphate-selective porin [Pseudomonadota bacterium]
MKVFFLLIFIGIFASSPILAKNQWKFDGRLEVDVSSVAGESSVQQSVESHIRRARLSAFRKISEKWAFYAQTDIKNERNDVQLTWFRFKASKKNELKIGKIAMPFGFDAYSSSETNLFMERALTSAFLPFSGVGASYHNKNKLLHMDMAVFGDDKFDLNGNERFGKAFVGRLYDRFKTDWGRIHWAFSWAHLNPEGRFRVRGNQESTFFASRFVDSGFLVNATSIDTFGASLLWKKRSWHLQSEYLFSQIDQRFEQNASVKAGFISFGKTFGFKRRFSSRYGRWKSGHVQPGASWEVGLRHSFMDLTDSNIAGGKLINTGIEVNYYLNNTSRLMLNLMHVKGDPEFTGLSRSANVLQLRLQFGF